MFLLLIKNRIKQIGRKTIVVAKHKVNANPKLKSIILFMFLPFPGIKAKIKGIDVTKNDAYMKMYRFESRDQLPADAQTIYDKLAEATTQQKKKE